MEDRRQHPNEFEAAACKTSNIQLLTPDPSSSVSYANSSEDDTMDNSMVSDQHGMDIRKEYATQGMFPQIGITRNKDHDSTVLPLPRTIWNDNEWKEFYLSWDLFISAFTNAEHLTLDSNVWDHLGTCLTYCSCHKLCIVSQKHILDALEGKMIDRPVYKSKIILSRQRSVRRIQDSEVSTGSNLPQKKMYSLEPVGF